MVVIIIVGNLTDGFTYYGPFDSLEAAREHARNSEELQGETYTISELKAVNNNIHIVRP